MSDYSQFMEAQRQALEQQPEVFHFRADQDASGCYWVFASRQDHGAVKMPVEFASSLADRVRAKQPTAAERIDGSVEDGRRYAVESGRTIC